MLPSDINSITKELKITSINVNKHVNELERMGLVVRERGSGKVELTELSEKILRLIKRLEVEVSVNLWKYKTGNTH
jgi:DNA-binding MarR family transcriptional regulator